MEAELGREVARWAAVVSEVSTFAAQLDRLRRSISAGRHASSPQVRQQRQAGQQEEPWHEASADMTAELLALYQAVLPTLKRAMAPQVPSRSTDDGMDGRGGSPQRKAAQQASPRRVPDREAPQADAQGIDAEADGMAQPPMKRRRVGEAETMKADGEEESASDAIADLLGHLDGDDMRALEEAPEVKVEDAPIEAKEEENRGEAEMEAKQEDAAARSLEESEPLEAKEESARAEETSVRAEEVQEVKPVDQGIKEMKGMKRKREERNEEPTDQQAGVGQGDASDDKDKLDQGKRAESEIIEEVQRPEAQTHKRERQKKTNNQSTAKERREERQEMKKKKEEQTPEEKEDDSIEADQRPARGDGPARFSNLALDEDLPVTKTPGPLCGAIRAPPEYVIPAGTAVAARTAKASKTRPAEWLLATVVRHLPDKQKYEVVDADPEESEENRKRYLLPRSCVIPLPTSVPDIWSKATQFSKGTMVLAMFPNTTAFYPATVQVGPRRRKDRAYVLLFDDDEEDGQKCKRYVSPRFVVHYDR